MSRISVLMTGLVLVAFTAATAHGLPAKDSQLENFRAVDIQGRQVDLDQLVAAKPDLVILFFFTPEGAERMALKLRRLDLMYGKDKIKIVGIGCGATADALKTFADGIGIAYHVIPDSPELNLEQKYGPFPAMPITFIVTDQKTVHSILSGGTEAETNLITTIAETFFQRHKTEQAQALAEAAVKAGEDEKNAMAVKGFALAAEGKLDEAQAEFGRIEFKEGMAKVALERGQYQDAIALGSEAASPYGEIIKGTAQMMSGQLDQAAATLGATAAKPARDWQKSEGINAEARIEHLKGNTDGAIVKYEQAIAIDPYNVVALSNEGAALREKGDLQKAAQALEKAQKIQNDELVAVMLKQVQQEMAKANDTKRAELIDGQIRQLQERLAQLKAAGADKSADPWTTPPPVIAFLPSAQPQAVPMARAGVDLALRREIEARLSGAGGVQVVEREVLDKLLQELNVGSSELADPKTQLRLGSVLSARVLGFIDFASGGPETLIYVRLVDTETTSIAGQFSERLADFSQLDATVDQIVAAIRAKIVDNRPFQGLIADAADEQAILTNLGARYGLKPGTRFSVLQEGPPIEAAGKIIGHRQIPVGVIEITEVSEDFSTCKVVSKQENAVFTQNMRIKQVK